MRRRQLVITVCNFKGGSGKTTTSVFLAHLLHQLGFRVLIVDADPLRQAQCWAEDADVFPFPVVASPVRHLYRKLAGFADTKLWDVVIIDTPPIDEQEGIVAGALAAATHVVVTLAPSAADFRELPKVWAALDGLDPVTRVLFTAVSRGSLGALEVYRDQLAADGHHVFTTHIPDWQLYMQANGLPVRRIGRPYESVGAELLESGDIRVQA